LSTVVDEPLFDGITHDWVNVLTDDARGTSGSRPIRLVLYVKGFPTTETGGPVVVMYSLVKEWLRSGAAEVTLIVQTDSREDEVREALGQPSGLTVFRLGYSPSAEDFRALPRVLRAFRNADVVQFNEFPIRLMGYVILAKARGIPTVYSSHGLATEEAPTFLGPEYPLQLASRGGQVEVRAPAFLVSLFIRVFRWVAPHWTAVVANSRTHMARAVEAENFNPSRMRVIPNGVEVNAVELPTPTAYKDPPRLLFVGKLERVKGPDLFLSALEILESEGMRFDVGIAGAGSLEAELRIAADRLKRQKVTFCGSVGQEAVRRLYQGADIVVVPSRYEAFGMVVLEAMAAGRPLVATSVGGIPEIVTAPRNAILVAPEAASIAAGIRRLASDPDLGLRMAVANREDVAAFSWSHIAPRYLDLFRELVPATKADD